ncbi:hypothetical protein Anapl_04573 [Anas platyrhynchos]|uniref:Uncharacterized protein n=1 Tax=Anas platyrhynchos TaxID=8839 RepID=R0JQG0_ANAPL|nr:hypothetical protein Anapl_04573 [Anas platyrhynchos]
MQLSYKKFTEKLSHRNSSQRNSPTNSSYRRPVQLCKTRHFHWHSNLTYTAKHNEFILTSSETIWVHSQIQ